jgi:hypothetical protein
MGFRFELCDIVRYEEGYTLEEKEKEKRKTKNTLSFFTREHSDEH